MATSTLKVILIAATVSSLLPAVAQDLPSTVSLVYPGTDGKLVYVPDSLGNRIPDFSNAGFKGGGVPIPYVAIKEIVWPVVGDNADTIQAAIDKVSALPPDANGYRGAVLLKMGTYTLEKPIYIKASGVVLRGEGRSDVGTVLFGKTTDAVKGPVFRRPALINIGSESGVKTLDDTKQRITDSYVPVGATTFHVRSAKSFKAGDKVIVRRVGNQDWIKAIGQDTLTVGRFRWKPFDIDYDRTIVAVNGGTITIDAPIFTAIESRWGGGEIIKYTEDRIELVGIENLRGVSDYDPTVRSRDHGNMDRDDMDRIYVYKGDEYFSDENHYFNFINITNTRNGWVRNMTALHFAGSVVRTNPGTKWITVQDCESREPVSLRWGARRFTFQINGELSLVQRCLSQKGRHSFVLQGHMASGNVFLECTAVNPYSSSEPHNGWANGILYDNVKAPLTARYWKNITIGWAGANIVFWNCEGDFLMQKPPTAQNYSFGHIGVNALIFNAALQDLTKPNGHVESMDRHVTPRSLYFTQLRERLGEGAVRNVRK